MLTTTLQLLLATTTLGLVAPATRICGTQVSTVRTVTPLLQLAPAPQREKGAAASTYFQPLQAGDILESTSSHRLICGAAALLVLALGVKIAVLAPPVTSAAGVIGYAATVLVGFEFADFGSGVYHWAMDNYGNGRTPVWGKQIEAFQGHHERPWTITHRQTCNNLHQSAIATMPALAGFLLLVNNVYALIFGTVGCTFIMLAQELHKWAHYSKRDVPRIADAMQGVGLAVNRRAHLAHHKPPFENNYCIVSGHCNGLLDRVGFFIALERLIHRLNGTRPRSWTSERFDFGDVVLRQ